MAGEMEFGNEIREPEVLDVEVGVVFENPPEEVDRPLADDIIRDDDIADDESPQHRCDDVIHI